MVVAIEFVALNRVMMKNLAAHVFPSLVVMMNASSIFRVFLRIILRT